MDAKQRFCPSVCTRYSVCLCDTGTPCSIAWAWWGSNLPRLAKLCSCSLNLTGNSAFHPIQPLPTERAVPSPLLRKLFPSGSEAPLALSPVGTRCQDPTVRMTWRKLVLHMGCMSVYSQGHEEFLEEVGFMC